MKKILIPLLLFPCVAFGNRNLDIAYQVIQLEIKIQCQQLTNEKYGTQTYYRVIGWIEGLKFAAEVLEQVNN